jgi:hypothetical protein
MILRIAAAVAGVIAATIACSRASPPAPESHAALRAIDSESVLSFTGLIFTDSCGDALASVLSVDSLEVRDREIGLFALRGIEEVEMRGVRARLAACPDREDSNDLAHQESPRFDEFLALPIRDLSLGFVSRVSAQPADLVFHDGETELLRIQAGRIDVSLGSGGLELSDGVAIQARDGRALRAGRAQWAVRDGTLRVSGRHEWSDASGARITPGDGYFALDRAGTLRPQP